MKMPRRWDVFGGTGFADCDGRDRRDRGRKFEPRCRGLACPSRTSRSKIRRSRRRRAFPQGLSTAGQFRTTTSTCRHLEGDSHPSPPRDGFRGFPSNCGRRRMDRRVLRREPETAGYSGRVQLSHSGGRPPSRATPSFNSDEGTAPATAAERLTPIVGHPVKWRDWGFRSTHLMTVCRLIDRVRPSRQGVPPMPISLAPLPAVSRCSLKRSSTRRITTASQPALRWSTAPI